MRIRSCGVAAWSTSRPASQITLTRALDPAIGSRMLIYSAINYVAFSVIFGLVMLDAGGPYLLGAIMVFLLLGFVGPARLTGAQLKADVPKLQHWWIMALVAALFLAPFYLVSTGADLLDIPAVSVKVLFSIAWVVVTFLYFRGIIFSMLRNRGD